MKSQLSLVSSAALTLLPVLASGTDKDKRPNVLLIIADDLGMGDVSAYGSNSIITPNIDAIAQNGICFNNGYATSATSTPSRYGLFTGMYPIRNPQAVILPGNAPLIITEDQPTMPKMFQAAGYTTAAIGKWHLGMGDGNINWNTQISPCANDVGFDYTCVVAATNDRVPTVYVENGTVVGLDPEDPIQVDYKNNFSGEPTALTNPEMVTMPWHHGHNMSIVNGIPRIGYMKGGESAKWKDDQMAEYFLSRAEDFLDSIPEDKPFFLYYGLHQPHVPRVPSPGFSGKSGLGVRGDVIMEADWCVGQIMEHLNGLGLMDNTIVIFTSDNGPVVQDGYIDGAEDFIASHDPCGGLRGGKYSLFDAGTHIPLFIMWKGHISPCSSNALVSQLDFFASFANLLGMPVPQGLDSEDHSDALFDGKAKGRDYLLLEAGKKLCLREGNYVLIPPYEGDAIQPHTGIETGRNSEYTLYNLKDDRHQDQDLSKSRPGKLRRLMKRYGKIVYESSIEHLQ